MRSVQFQRGLRLNGVALFLFSEFKEREFAAKASEFFNNLKLKNLLN